MPDQLCPLLYQEDQRYVLRTLQCTTIANVPPLPSRCLSVYLCPSWKREKGIPMELSSLCDFVPCPVLLEPCSNPPEPYLRFSQLPNSPIGKMQGKPHSAREGNASLTLPHPQVTLSSLSKFSKEQLYNLFPFFTKIHDLTVRSELYLTSLIKTVKFSKAIMRLSTRPSYVSCADLWCSCLESPWSGS